jgi:hypothetical protein
MSDRPRAIRRPIAVAVEGQDYLHLLLSQVDGPPEFENVELWDFCLAGSVADWLTDFRTLRNFEMIRAIGVIRDAEADSTATAKQLHAAFARNELRAAENSGELVGGPPASGFLVMPHEGQRGCLEHAMLDACAEHLRTDCARSFLQCVDDGARNDNWRAKVQVHALIASCEKPSITLGQSAKEGLWDFGRPSLSVMIDFIRRLVRAGN